jgi:ribA/ribD-fused uncharacterized protein
MSAISTIDSFRGKYYFLSNFFPAEVTYNGLTYQNNEAAFQAQKTYSKEERIEFTTLEPKDAKRRGRRVRLRRDWEQVKDRIMEEIVRAKFSQNEELKEQLLATGEAQLVEGNRWNDRYWGVDIRSGVGENHLGKILMKVRSELRISQ